jgi:hypothetical protein
MKNKQIIQLLLLVSVVYTQSLAQAPSSADHKFYIKAYAGDDLIAPGSLRSSSSSYSMNNGNSFSTSNTGLGAGLRFGGGVGFIVNEFINLGIDADYLKDKKINGSTTDATNSEYLFYSQTTTSSVLSIIPNITFKALSKPTYYIYNRLGLILTANTKIESKFYDSVVSTQTDILTADTKYSYSINLGVQFAIGIQFNLTKNVRGFAEIVGNYLPASPASSTEKYTQIEPGVDNNSNYQYKYLKSGDFNSVSTQNSTGGENVTSNQSLMTQNINSIGINIGLAFRF